MPRKDYSEVIRRFDEDGEPRPRSTDPFSGEDVGGWTDGDYPQWLQQDMDIHLPSEVLRQYGERQSTRLNGDYWMIPPEKASDMIRDLEECGFRVENGRKINFW